MNTNTAQQLLPKAFSLHQAGNLDEAEALYRTILEETPNDPQVLSMLGMAQLQRGNWEEGVRFLNASLEIDPDQPDTLNNFGYALHMIGRHEEALAKFDRAIELFPDHTSAYYNRGNLQQNLGLHQEACASYQKALALRSNHPDTLIRLGNSYAALDLKDEALTNYIKALNLRPNDPGISNNLGLALKGLTRYQEAINYFQKAIALNPAYIEAHHNLSITLKELGRNTEALASCDKTLTLAPDHSDAHNLRGLLLQRLGQEAEALVSYETALSIDSNNTAALLHMGILHMEMGRNSDAIKCFERALSLDPACTEAYHNLASLDYFTEDGRLEQLQAVYADRSSLPEKQRVYLNFAMGRTLEQLGRHDEAFDAYKEGNRLHYTGTSFDEASEEQHLENSLTLFNHNLFEECRGLSSELPATNDECIPVFIIGMPRSGTTLIEQILASHPELFGAGELDAIDKATIKARAALQDAPDMATSLQRLRKIGQEYQEHVWKLAPDAQYITDKMPSNFRHLGLIHLMLPNAKFIHVMRDPMDSCFSCYTQRFSVGHEYSYDLEAVGRYYQRYAKLMQHWHQILPPGSILDVHYNEIIANPEHEVRRMLDHLGLAWNDACLNFHENRRTVKTASLNQVRKPIYSSSIARWKKFEKHLAPLIGIVSKSD